ncbi:MAG: methylated-DNA--[protein]-cysteine S-methyltransferase [Deltaproteobacteria bacterium]|nr:methylated-DNA--[protein]-cysteine S-methyltransferase [Deltaproteobacteria bacterium]MBW2415453.1 methylated-DNA--[protein]-cysteine S-methyltransferase [Deltaproteobacteria bacterium]
MDVSYEELDSRLGRLSMASAGGRLLAVDFEDGRARIERRLASRFGGIRLRSARDAEGFASRLREYLAGDLDAIDDIPVDAGGTVFQRRVWTELRRIPLGETRSYAQLADAIGRRGSFRAVGSANASNPVAIVVPCHRVVGSDGSLTGYAGGIERKRFLLEHEGAL